MFRIFKKSNKKGFTVAEIAVAAGLFVLFAGAVFSLYRMGSRMFVSGSWKYQRQKEAERFFEILKERVEQSSPVCRIDPGAASSSQIVTAQTRFGALKNQTFDLSSSDNLQLAEFIVSKPNLSVINGDKTGIVLFHSLMLKKSSNTDNLFDLHLRVARNADDGAYFPGGFNIVDFGTLQLADFNENVDNYSLGPVPHTFILKDVASITVIVQEGEQQNGDDSNAIKPNIFGLAVEMHNPKHDKTKLIMNFRAKIDGSLPVVDSGE